MDEEILMALIQSILVESHNSRATFQTITGLGKWRKSNSLPAFDSTIFSRFRRLSLEAEASSSEGEAADPFQVSLSSARTIEEASELVCAALITKLASRNGILPENIDSSKAISDYGVDSLVAVELRNWITREMDSTVPILELLANSPMTSLSMKIASRSRLVHLGVEKETFAGFSQ
jgi:acyl carrier protein